MIKFSAITNFNARIAALKDVRRGVYATVEDEILSSFKGLTIEQIRQNRDMILFNDDYIVIKLRIPDKKHRLSKKDGYRLIYLVYKETEEVIFLDVYPKNGLSQQLDIDDKQLVDLVNQLADEREKGLLTPFKIEPLNSPRNNDLHRG
jgi:mRNA-degrading endonuclease RelE of RelBE toxin-antitoxin system